MDFRTQSVVELARQVRERELSARELVQHALDRIDALNPTLNAFVAVDGERALADAAAVDERVVAGDDVGPLAGVPCGVKDLEDAAGFVTTKGSHAFANDAPARHDSSMVAWLKAAGAVVVGKTNTPELGWMGDTVNVVFGATRNPWDATRSPGGSSGGSAAAIAAGMVPLATGSDGGGSLRIPGAACGLSAMKPSLGRVASGGSEPPDWHHLSTRGPMTRTVADLAVALDAVVGPDPTDLRSLPMSDSRWADAVVDAKAPLQVAWSPTLGYGRTDREVRIVCEGAVRVLEELGAEVTEVEAVFDADPVGHWLTLTSTYNLRTLERFRDTDVWEKIDPGLQMVVESARDLHAVDIVRAEDECHRLNVRLVELFRDVRLLLAPVTAGQTPRSGEPGTIDGEPDLNWVQNTYPFNMTRSPAGTVCAGFTTDGMPVGLQLVGPQHADVAVLRTMAALETALGVDTLAPV